MSDTSDREEEASRLDASEEAPGQPLAAVLFTGEWRRSSDDPCSRAYPERISFRDDGVYIADSEDDRFREWQAGDFEVVEEHTVKVQLSTDAMAPYEFAFLDRDHVVFMDDEGCSVEYERGR